MRFLIFLFFVPFFAFAGWEDVISNQEAQAQLEKVKVINQNLKLEKFTTKEDFEDFLIKKLYDKIKKFCSRPLPVPMLYKWVELGTNGVSHSNTNLQKVGVDEPEILKVDNDYVVYYNKDLHKIFLIQAPGGNELDLSKVKILSTIKVPKVIRPYSVNLFLYKKQLVVIWTRYSEALRQTVTDVVVYKILNDKFQFQRLYDTKWSYVQARIVDGKLYVVTSYNLSSVIRNICDQLEPDLLKKVFLPASVNIYFDKNSHFKVGNKTYPIAFNVFKPEEKNILYLPKDLENIDLWKLSFALVNIIDLDNQTRQNQYIIFGNISAWQIHMTLQSLYLVGRYYENYAWRCGANMRCLVPYFYKGWYTLIHKFDLKNFQYVNSQVVPGSLINQYSMDENQQGYFRIFTKNLYPQRYTNLFVLDKNLNLVGKLTNIAEWEDFKSARFEDDKAFLVTFKATDPLFVIDLKNPAKPKILGQLKIPGYSLYLHTLKFWNWISWDYLLGIGQQAKEISSHRSLPKNVKIDLYKVNYVSGSVKQVGSLILGKEEKYGINGSYTPVFDNPRTLVLSYITWDTQKIVKLFLPVYLAEDKTITQCTQTYEYENWQKKVTAQHCIDRTVKKPYFVGVKALNIFSTWIVEDKNLSKNLLQYLNISNLFSYKQQNHRCGYFKWKKWVVFEINTKLADFYDKITDKILWFKK